MYFTEKHEVERITREIPLHIKKALRTPGARECEKCRFYSEKKGQCRLEHCYFFED